MIENFLKVLIFLILFGLFFKYAIKVFEDIKNKFNTKK